MQARPLSLSDQLRVAILASGLSLYRIARLSGVSDSHLSRFMRGKRNMCLVISNKVCKVVGLHFGPAIKAGR